jgi:hypothetical protein
VSPLVTPPSHHLVMPAGCRIASCRPLIVLPSRQLVVPACCYIASPCPLIALPSHRLVMPAGCCIASCRHLVAPPSCQLIAPACCRNASPRSLVSPRAALLSSLRAGWLLHCLLTHHPLVVLPSRHLIVPPLVVLLRQLVVAPSSLVVLSLHRPLVISSCWLVVALHVLAPPSCPLVIVHRRRHRTPLNAAAISNKSATAAIERRCCIASCRPLIVPPSRQLVMPACCYIASPHPLIVLPSRRLVMPAGCCIASCRHLVAPPSCQLVAPACCRIASPRSLVAPRAALPFSLRAGWLLHRLLMRHPLVISPSRHLIVPPLVVLSRQLVVAPSSLVVLSLHRPLVISLCWLVVALHLLAPPSCPLVIVHRRRHRTPSNAAAISNKSATAAIERRLYRPPLPQMPSIATVKRQRPPSPIAAVKC